jgi:mannose-6-phosphate isomerase-like protein (cupin superfamily)
MAMDKRPDWWVPKPEAGEFWIEERCYITELLGAAASPEASLALARVQPGVTTALHSLAGVAERYIVRRGSGIVEIDGVHAELGEGDQAIIPEGAAQRITNSGDGDLEFYCLCVPAFTPECYVDLETDGRP